MGYVNEIISYGVPACWLLERFPEAMVYGIDPDSERVRVASMEIGEDGVITHSRARSSQGAGAGRLSDDAGHDPLYK